MPLEKRVSPNQFRIYDDIQNKPHRKSGRNVQRHLPRRVLLTLLYALATFGCEKSFDRFGADPPIGTKGVWEGTFKMEVVMLLGPAVESDLRIWGSFVSRGSLYSLVIPPGTSELPVSNQMQMTESLWRVHGTLAEKKQILVSRIERIGPYEPSESTRQLSDALSRGDVSGTATAIAAGADPDIDLLRNSTLLSLWGNGAISAEKRYQLARMLIDAKVNVNASDDDGVTALHIASRNHETKLVHLLLSAGASVNTEGNIVPATALGNALDGIHPYPDFPPVSQAERHTVDLLIRHGARLSDRERSGSYQKKLDLLAERKLTDQ
jgi:hypothetical protein